MLSPLAKYFPVRSNLQKFYSQKSHAQVSQCWLPTDYNPQINPQILPCWNCICSCSVTLITDGVCPGLPTDWAHDVNEVEQADRMNCKVLENAHQLKAAGQ